MNATTQILLVLIAVLVVGAGLVLLERRSRASRPKGPERPVGPLKPSDRAVDEAARWRSMGLIDERGAVAYLRPEEEAAAERVAAMTDRTLKQSALLVVAARKAGVAAWQIPLLAVTADRFVQVFARATTELAQTAAETASRLSAAFECFDEVLQEVDSAADRGCRREERLAARRPELTALWSAYRRKTRRRNRRRRP